MAEMPEGSVGAVVCDPPYGIGFMGAEFDTLGDGASHQPWHAEWLRECFRVLVPGGKVLAFGGTRVYHRMAAAFDDAGFIDIGISSWGYGSGFPKPTHNIAIVIDKQAKVLKQRGKAIPFVGLYQAGTGKNSASSGEPLTSHALPPYTPITDDAKRWNGWGTNLKPAWEPFIVGTKPG
ncbi:MAG: site-specific DNA-methyltransferase [Actinobacteria bacterium]|nr:site-specific DNA-methyltransferase [Actinomycetota bacterium]